jgi:hypothetical protein
MNTHQEISLVSRVVDLPLLNETPEALMNRLSQGVEAVSPAKGSYTVPLSLHRLAQQLHVHRLLGALQPRHQKS